MILNLIETVKTSIYNPKDAKNTIIPFSEFKLFKNFKIHTSKNKRRKVVKQKLCFMLICIALSIFYVEGHTA